MTSTPARASAPTPEKGLRFLHARILDPHGLAQTPSIQRPATCEVTSVQRGRIYYGVVEEGKSPRKGSECALPERWPVIWAGPAE
jgi:hypothetical protein